MKVLIACEYSGVVRRAFWKELVGWQAPADYETDGHLVFSNDLLPAEDASKWHLRCDVHDLIDGPGMVNFWDLIIAHPPCTHLAVSGARWFKDKQEEQRDALKFVWDLMTTRASRRIAIENPVSVISSRIRKPDQIIQPWQFGHGETKTTCLWLWNLPPLKPTNIVEGREQRVWKMGPSPDRWKERSRTYPGIAEAMAQQWRPDKLDPVEWVRAGYHREPAYA